MMAHCGFVSFTLFHVPSAIYVCVFLGTCLVTPSHKHTPGWLQCLLFKARFLPRFCFCLSSSAFQLSL